MQCYIYNKCFAYVSETPLANYKQQMAVDNYMIVTFCGFSFWHTEQQNA